MLPLLCATCAHPDWSHSAARLVLQLQSLPAVAAAASWQGCLPGSTAGFRSSTATRAALLQQQQLQGSAARWLVAVNAAAAPWRALWPVHHQQASSGFSTTSSTTTSSPEAAGASSGDPPRNLRGRLPSSGPAQRTLRALPFAVPRAAALAAFEEYHGQHWYQSRQRPLLRKPFKETFLPFWMASGGVRVEVKGAEVGHERLVTRHDKRTGRAEPRHETVWSRVRVDMAWERQLQPEELVAQLYASWKYPRPDVDALRPGAAVRLAQPITPDMLRAAAGSGTGTRRVGPFTVEPLAARRLLMAQVEAEERRRAEGEISRLAGAQHVRFVDMHCTWVGSTGSATGSAQAAAAASTGGLDLSPVYVPCYIFSWWHGGAKVRTFVSGVDASAVSGVQVLDDTKLATLAATATAGTALLLGAPASVLLWAGLVVPFFAVGVVARFWPLLRSKAVEWKERLQQRWRERTGTGPDYCEASWSAAFVHAYEAEELRRRQAEQRQAYEQARYGSGGAGGGRTAQQDPREFFEQFMRDPFSWFDQFVRQQQQQQQGQYRQQQQGQQGQYRQQQQWGGGGGSSGGSSSSGSGGGGHGGGRGGGSGGPPGDPRGFYSTLGVQPGCSTQEVQAAFRGLALQHHPDRFSTPADKERATKRFQVITQAYSVLRDPKKRALYDAGQYSDRA